MGTEAEKDRLIYAWQAARHQWGPGKIHEIQMPEVGSTVTTQWGEKVEIGAFYKPDDRTELFERTLCGLRLDETPGKPMDHLSASKVTCLGCRKRARIDADRALRAAEWEAKRVALQAEKQQEEADWWEWYEEYLKTPKWREKARLVLRRAGGRCEGCLLADATQVHHLTYERVGDEMLFDLVAICKPCHDRIPSKKRGK